MGSPSPKAPGPVRLRPMPSDIPRHPSAKVVIPPEILNLLRDPIALGEALGYKGDPQTGRKRFGQLHRDMLAHVTSGTRKAIAVPRGHAKTTCIDVILPIWKLARDPDKRIMFASATLDLSKKILGEVRDRLAGDLEIKPGLFVPVSRVFPHLALSVPDKRKSGPTDRINISGRTAAGGRESSIYASAVGANTAGNHPTDIHFDDLQNEQNSRTWSQRQKVIEYVKQAVPLARYPDSPICAVMTAWAPDDLLAWMQDHKDWDVVVKGVWDGAGPEGEGPGPDGAWPLCDSFMNAAEIEMVEKEVGPVFFAAQYLNTPIPAEDALFDQPMTDAFEDLSELAPTGQALPRIPAGQGQILLWDPVHRLEGMANQKRSLNGLVRVMPVPAGQLGINWLDRNRNVFFVTGCWEVPGGTDDACCFVEDLVAKDPSIKGIWIEKNAAQETLKPWLEERGRVNGVNIRLQSIAGGSAVMRLQGLATAVRKGYLRVTPNAEGRDLLLRRMKEYPLSDSDDVLNALALLSQVRERRGSLPGMRPQDSTPLHQRIF